MAATFESVQTASATNANSVTVARPTSLAEFDLMVAIISNGGKNDPATAATLAGWTQLSNTNNTTNSFALDVTILAKVAQLADVSTTDYTFSVTNTTDVVLGSIMRISGGFANVGSAYVIDADTATPVSGTNTYTGGVTPNEADSLIIIGQATGGGNSNTHSGYALTTSSPTFTERIEFGTNYNDGSSNDFLYMGVATGSRSAATATGNYTVVDTNLSTDNVHGFVISINPVSQSANVTPTKLTVNPTFNAPAMASGVNFTPTKLSVSPTFNSPTVDGRTKIWTTTTKS